MQFKSSGSITISSFEMLPPLIHVDKKIQEECMTKKIPGFSIWQRQQTLNLAFLGSFYFLLNNKIVSLGKMNSTQRLNNSFYYNEKELIKTVVYSQRNLDKDLNFVSSFKKMQRKTMWPHRVGPTS